jgi:hypothetical protein
MGLIFTLFIFGMICTIIFAIIEALGLYDFGSFWIAFPMFISSLVITVYFISKVIYAEVICNIIIREHTKRMKQYCKKDTELIKDIADEINVRENLKNHYINEIKESIYGKTYDDAISLINDNIYFLKKEDEVKNELAIEAYDYVLTELNNKRK